MSKPIFDGSVHKTGSPLSFVPTLMGKIKDKHIMSPMELKWKKMLEALKKGKKKKTKKKGGGKSKYNIKMARKFRRTRRKRGSGPGGDGGSGSFDTPKCTDQQYYNPSTKKCVDYCVPPEKWHPKAEACWEGGRKRKKCSKKKTKKKLICYRGTKKNLKKLGKMTKRLNIRLTKCSKIRLKKWNKKRKSRRRKKRSRRRRRKKR